MTYVFGPVPSRRLGLSLGIDLVPAKVCSFDCLYCQVGRTTEKRMGTKPFAPLDDVLKELKHRLEKITPDTITLSGSGEPTLHADIDRVIAGIKRLTDIKTAILTNGSLLWKEEVRGKVLGAHIIAPTLSTVFEETFRVIHRPHPELKLDLIIDGLMQLRKVYRGQILLEVVLLAGFNDNERELEGLKKVIDQISPDKIQLNTVVRPPADTRAVALDRQHLVNIKAFFGSKAEIIADIPPKRKRQAVDSMIDTILDTTRRRPMRIVDVANAMDLPRDEVEGLVKGLMLKGKLCRENHGGEIYYKTLD